MRIDALRQFNSVIQRGGLRLADINKYNQTDKPLITIITATYNAARYLPITIQSIRQLTYGNVEWLIVDGGSTDGTIELILQHSDLIDYWVSEPDNGIYDAWNKGISLASGNWIAFLGAGDAYRPHALTAYVNAINVSSELPELISSKVTFINSEGLTLRVWGSAFKWPEFKKYMNVAHVGALHHKGLFKEHGYFDTSYSSSSDYEILMRCGAKLKTLYLDLITAEMLVGGISNGYQSIYETYLIQKKYGFGISAKFRYWFACAKRFIRPFVRGY